MRELKDQQHEFHRIYQVPLLNKALFYFLNTSSLQIVRTRSNSNLLFWGLDRRCEYNIYNFIIYCQPRFRNSVRNNRFTILMLPFFSENLISTINILAYRTPTQYHTDFINRKSRREVPPIKITLLTTT